MRNKAIVFVGHLNSSRWDIWIPFCEKYDLDVYIISYAESKDEANMYIKMIKKKFTFRLKAYYIDRSVVNNLEYNTWSIHPRSIQFWRLWDFYMKHPILYTYNYLLKARLDLILPEWELPDNIASNTIYVPKYVNHPYGLTWSDQLAYGDRDVMKKYCTIWEQLPPEPFEFTYNIFFHEYSPESMVQTLFKQQNLNVIACFDKWELSRKREINIIE
jgi:hypothetical protein